MIKKLSATAIAVCLALVLFACDHDIIEGNKNEGIAVERNLASEEQPSDAEKQGSQFEIAIVTNDGQTVILKGLSLVGYDYIDVRSVFKNVTAENKAAAINAGLSAEIVNPFPNPRYWSALRINLKGIKTITTLGRTDYQHDDWGYQ